jgi:hydroxyacyl-ACP dehydratase HTD2-like protein with hotdog domain
MFSKALSATLRLGRRHDMRRDCSHRLLSSEAISALDKWISTEKCLVLKDTYHRRHLEDLFITLPTRDGTRRPYESPKEGSALGYGHHLAFFHPRTPEKYLRADGTDADFCPPEPFVRRMWAGGKMEWKLPLTIGAESCSVATVDSVSKKGFDRGSPMVFVKQRIEVKSDEQSVTPNIVEERTHVYLALGTAQKRIVRQGKS